MGVHLTSVPCGGGEVTHSEAWLQCKRRGYTFKGVVTHSEAWLHSLRRGYTFNSHDQPSTGRAVCGTHRSGSSGGCTRGSLRPSCGSKPLLRLQPAPRDCLWTASRCRHVTSAGLLSGWVRRPTGRCCSGTARCPRYLRWTSLAPSLPCRSSPETRWALGTPGSPAGWSAARRGTPAQSHDCWKCSSWFRARQGFGRRLVSRKRTVLRCRRSRRSAGISRRQKQALNRVICLQRSCNTRGLLRLAWTNCSQLYSSWKLSRNSWSFPTVTRSQPRPPPTLCCASWSNPTQGNDCFELFVPRWRKGRRQNSPYCRWS